LIQRDYEHQGLFEYLNRNSGQINLKDMKKTDSGRVVFGGDGITPDQKYENPPVTRLEAMLSARMAFFFFAPEFFASREARIGKDWRPDDAVLESFRSFASSRGIEFTAAEFERERSWVLDRLREELFITAFSKQESDRLTSQNDPEILRAVDSLPASKTLVEKARQIIARQPKKPAVPAETR
jgi:carboxyl-terminal processing protease